MFIMGVKEMSSEIKYHYCLYLNCYITLYVSKHTALLYLTFLFLVSFEEPRTRSATSTLSYYKSPSAGNSLRPSAKGIIEGKEEPHFKYNGWQLQKQCQWQEKSFTSGISKAAAADIKTCRPSWKIRFCRFANYYTFHFISYDVSLTDINFLRRQNDFIIKTPLNYLLN